MQRMRQGGHGGGIRYGCVFDCQFPSSVFSLEHLLLALNLFSDNESRCSVYALTLLTSKSPLKDAFFPPGRRLSTGEPCVWGRGWHGESSFLESRSLGGVNAFSGHPQIVGAHQINKHTDSQVNRKRLLEWKKTSSLALLVRWHLEQQTAWGGRVAGEGKSTCTFQVLHARSGYFQAKRKSVCVCVRERERERDAEGQ